MIVRLFRGCQNYKVLPALLARHSRAGGNLCGNALTLGDAGRYKKQSKYLRHTSL
jgi:hypothetical protein